MAKQYSFPDPNDRSPNTPSIIVPSAQIIGLYNRFVDKDQQKITNKVQDWFTDKAKNEYHWDGAKFHGSQCLLEVVMEKKVTPDEK